MLMTVVCMQAVRAKSVVFLHRMLTMLGVGSLNALSFALPILVQSSDVGDIEQVVQLFNLMLTDLGETCLSVSQSFLFILLDKLEYLTISVAGETIAPHVEVECLGVRKLYISVIYHVFSTGSKMALFCDQNVRRVPEVYHKIAAYSKDAPFSNETKIALLRSSLGVWLEVCKAWKDSDSPLVQQLNTTVLLNDILPFLLRAPLDGSLNAKDAQTQTVLADLGGLLWTVRERMGAEVFSNYIFNILQCAGWTNRDSAETLNSLLTSNINFTAFREEFKKVIRASVA